MEVLSIVTVVILCKYTDSKELYDQNLTLLDNDLNENIEHDPDTELMIILICMLGLSGLLAIISNMLVIIANHKHRSNTKMFDRALISLAWLDVLTGLLGTPIICCIYYYHCE